MNILELYDIASDNNIEVCHKRLSTMVAFSVPNCIVVDVSQLHTLAEMRVCFSHELGHQMKNAFYNIKNTLETRERQEERATRWAVDVLIPASELIKAVESGYTEVYQLAERFDVTENFVRESVRIHKLQGELKELN